MQAIRERVDVCADFGQFTNIAAAAPARAGREGPLLALEGQSLSGRFHGWRGASGQRYICTVFATPEAAGACLQAIVIAVARQSSGACEPVMIGQTGALPDCFALGSLVAQARGLGANEWHVHLIARSRAQRSAAIADLQSFGDGFGFHADDLGH